jgi:negative regulator of sigma E activity
MSERLLDDAVTREILSALADGHADANEAARACGAWRHQPDARATWHAYHLIGETMRSPDQSAASDSEAFLQRLRGRLAEEPVVLAPQSAQSVGQAAQLARADEALAAAGMQPLKRRMWAGPMAVAASFAVIVGALTANLGGPAGNPDGAQLARSGLGWSEGNMASTSMASALGPGGSFSAARAQGPAWPSLDPRLEQAMVVQRPQPNPPATFSDAPGVVRVSAEQAP